MIVRVNKEVLDGLYFWNGKGWDQKLTEQELKKPALRIKDGTILWLDLPEPVNDDQPKTKKKTEAAQ